MKIALAFTVLVVGLWLALLLYLFIAATFAIS